MAIDLDFRPGADLCDDQFESPTSDALLAALLELAASAERNWATNQNEARLREGAVEDE